MDSSNANMVEPAAARSVNAIANELWNRIGDASSSRIFPTLMSQVEAQANEGSLSETLFNIPSQNVDTAVVLERIDEVRDIVVARLPIKTQEPAWMVRKEQCDQLFSKCGKNVDIFLRIYIIQLLKKGESLIPERYLNFSKINEIYAVLLHYFPTQSNTKYFFKTQVCEILQKRLNSVRREVYKNIKNIGETIGVTPDGKIFCYPDDGNVIRDSTPLGPPLRIKIIEGIKIPAKYDELEFLIFIKKISHNRYFISLLHPTTGLTEIIQSYK